MNENLAARFQWPEYVVFSIMLLISAGIGVFYGCFGGKQKTTSEFLMANRSMGVFPMAMSLIASFMSAITLLGTPVEMYQFGTQYWVVGISYFFVMASTSYLYLPVFFNLQITSAYEYLEKRFSKSLRLLGSGIFTLQMCIYMAIVVYAPALALQQVTGINVYGAVAAIFVVCIFYTALGGMKAVMWTDTFQVFIMFGAMLAVIIKGAIDAGGPTEIWNAALEGNRVEFLNFDPDPRVRHTVWGLIIGGYFTWVTIYGTNQAQVQRYLTVPTKGKAQCAIWINCFGLFFLLTICCYGGLVIYATYKDCHPLYTGRAQRPDQLFPLFVMDTLGDFPGLPGLFVAGIFSGALSTVSSGLNSLAAISLEDFIRGTCFPNITDEKATFVSKCLAVGFGVVCFGLVFVAEQLGGVLQAALSIFGMIGGPLLGVFTLGMFFPYANSIGAFIGTLCSLGFMFWLGLGTNFALASGELQVPKLNFSTDGCSPNDTITIPLPKPGIEGGMIEFYRISYMWYSMIGCLLTISVGLLVSVLTSNVKKTARQIDPDLLSPPVYKLYMYLGWDVGTEFKLKKQALKCGLDNPTFQRDMMMNGNKKKSETKF